MTSAIKRTPSAAASLAPSYRTTDVELSRLGGNNPAASTASLSDVDVDEDAPPPYAPDAAAAFTPSLQLQIQTPGKGWLTLPLPPRPVPIPVYGLAAGGHVDDASAPAFVSLRHARRSGSCHLVAGGEGHDDARPLSTTTYRFGLGRHPRVRLVDPDHAISTTEGGTSGSNSGDDELDDSATWDAFELTPKGLLTRAIVFKTRLGTFEWRYASRRERKALPDGPADNLLVLDRVVRVFRAPPTDASSSSSRPPNEEEVRTPVARLVRNAELRSPGSGASTAGNGGRLLIDLDAFLGARADDNKTARRMAPVLAVTTAVAMLKREVDRRRAQQIAIMASAGSGG